MPIDKKPLVVLPGDITVMRVSGNAVRAHLDPDFNNFGHHYRFDFIPKNEIWLDEEHVSDEGHYFVNHALAEMKAMKKGVPYGEADTIGARVERRERDARAPLTPTVTQAPEADLMKIRERLLLTSPDGIKVYLVDGKIVRDKYYIDFTEGGHDLVYKFIPKGEIWIDNDVMPNERNAVLAHEYWERIYMSKGTPYEQAHQQALKMEQQYRTSGLKVSA